MGSQCITIFIIYALLGVISQLIPHRRMFELHDADYPSTDPYANMDWLLAGVLYGVPVVVFFAVGVLAVFLSALIRNEIVSFILSGITVILPIGVGGWIRYMIYRKPTKPDPRKKKKNKAKRRPRPDYDNLPY